ncbi:Aminotransferase class-V [Aureococcus anophagefferens]|nr:Aminotransferase class-V [Aureococcus anophagefferens]
MPRFGPRRRPAPGPGAFEADAWADAAAALKHRRRRSATGRSAPSASARTYNSDDDLEAFVDALFAFDDDYYVRRGYGRPAKPATKAPADADADS